MELAALQGAEETIRRFRPKLMISAYHKDDDLSALPGFVRSLRLGYRFHLRHTTMHGEETVLSAAADDRPT